MTRQGNLNQHRSPKLYPEFLYFANISVTQYPKSMKPLLILLGLILFFSIPVEAQIGGAGKLLRKVEDKLEKKIEEKVFQKIEEKIEGDTSTTRERPDSTNTPAVDLEKIFGNGEALDLEKTYDYNFSIDYLITTEGEAEPTEMTQLYTTDHNYLGMIVRNAGESQEDTPAIFDLEQHYFIIIQGESEQAIVFKMDPLDDQAPEEDEDNAFSIKKTGETKTVAGYPCVKYVYSGDGEGEMWVTDKIDYKSFDMFNYFKRMNKKNQTKRSHVWDSGVEGLVLHMKGVDRDGKAFEMLATDVHENTFVQFDMSKYEVMNMTRFGN